MPVISAGLFSGLSSLSGNLLQLYKVKQDGSYSAQQKLLHTLREQEAERAHTRTLERDGHLSASKASELATSQYYEAERDWRQARIAVHVKEIQDRLERQRDETPFPYSLEEFYDLVFEATNGGKTPALLVAPFFRDDLSGQANDEGPHSFRVCIRRSWLQASWADDLATLDGVLNRPLRKTDLDILIIQKALRELPVVLVYGEVQSNQRVWPSLCAWNIVNSPEMRSVQINFPPISLPENNADQATAARNQLAFEDELGGSTAITAGLIAEWFHLVRNGRAPRLHRILPENMGPERRTIAAGLAASYEVVLESNRIDVLSARVAQANIYMEGALPEHAANSALEALRVAESYTSEKISQLTTDTLRRLGFILDSLGYASEGEQARSLLESVARATVRRNLGWEIQ
ncbi:hypothetical protein [Kitasatospora sp. NPDC001175]|uniref:hypothetical protein n=1 Tax=Kitasatospora sp. NPDC001175 TaxID=3157103 RepID=UPI003CFE2ACD